jgi:hypothetical protein
MEYSGHTGGISRRILGLHSSLYEGRVIRLDLIKKQMGDLLALPDNVKDRRRRCGFRIGDGTGPEGRSDRDIERVLFERICLSATLHAPCSGYGVVQPSTPRSFSAAEFRSRPKKSDDSLRSGKEGLREERGRDAPPQSMAIGRFEQPDRTRSPAWTHPVIANGKRYVRDQDLLFCYDVKAK